jgi:hypothetical protein
MTRATFCTRNTCHRVQVSCGSIFVCICMYIHTSIQYIGAASETGKCKSRARNTKKSPKIATAFGLNKNKLILRLTPPAFGSRASCRPLRWPPTMQRSLLSFQHSGFLKLRSDVIVQPISLKATIPCLATSAAAAAVLTAAAAAPPAAAAALQGGN